MNNRKTRTLGSKSGYAKKRVQRLNEHSTSHQLLCYAVIFELRNPLLCKAVRSLSDGLMPGLSRFKAFFNSVVIGRLHMFNLPHGVVIYLDIGSCNPANPGKRYLVLL